MTACDVIVLSSSPAPSLVRPSQRPGLVAQMSSSPGFPSPSFLMRTETSRLARVGQSPQSPERATVGFVTTATLMKGRPSLSRDGRTAEHEPDRCRATAVDGSRKTSGKTPKAIPKERVSAGAEANVAQKKSRIPGQKPKIITEADGVTEHRAAHEGLPPMVVEKRPRKPRVRKDKDETQAKIPKGRIMKPGTDVGKEMTTAQSKRSAMVSGAPVPANGTGDPDVVRSSTAEDNLGLEIATARRKVWTPPKNTTQKAEGSDRRPGSNTEVLEPAQTMPLELSAKGFGNLYSSFGFDQAQGEVTKVQAAQNIDSTVLTKRRKIELESITVHGKPAATATKRSKSPRKKPVTITEKATAQYVAKDSNPTAPLLQYFVPTEPSGTGDVQGIDQIGAGQKTGKTKTIKRRSSVKVTTTKPKAKKGTATLPILLSPESALKKVDKQDILFGTSSQLAEEESPTFLRDLQQALKVSEASPDPDSFADSAYGDETPMKPKHVRCFKGGQIATSNRLWSSAARDSEGNLITAEVLDLANSSPACQSTKDAEATREVVEGRVGLPQSPREGLNDDTWMVLDDTASSVVLKGRTDRQMHEQDDGHPHVEVIVNPTTEASLRKRPRSKSQRAKVVKAKSKLSVVQPPPNAQMPEFRGYPTTRLATELASYGFKPVKSRDQIIALLEKCWESKNRVALQLLATNVNLNKNTKERTETESNIKKPISKTSPLKYSKRLPLPNILCPTEPAGEAVPVSRPRGRPRKNTESSAIVTRPLPECKESTAVPPGHDKPDKARRKVIAVHLEEIDDSDTPPTPSPPRRRSSPTTPQPLDLTPATAEQTPNLTPVAAQKHLFASITKAITTFPRSTNQKHPTWHEKILMYDPIILEDLATWLNTEGLGRIGVDEEVGSAVVRAWCEERSVCCLWKENMRGGTRARY